MPLLLLLVRVPTMFIVYHVIIFILVFHLEEEPNLNFSSLIDVTTETGKDNLARKGKSII